MITDDDDDMPPELVILSNDSQTQVLNTYQKIVPVTILTGFLGSGKTTLLSWVLSANHNKRIAVVENEISEGLGIETLIAKSGVTGNNLKDFIELPNGCICCTIKDSLILTLEKLIDHQDRFDYILIELTGLANPGPVISSFWLDDGLNTSLRLDGVICVVDGYNLEKYLNNSEICNDIIQQISFADRILLNKCDLISNIQIEKVRDIIKSINCIAEIYQTIFSEISCDWILDIDGLNLRKAYEDTLNSTNIIPYNTFCEPCYENNIPLNSTHNISYFNTHSIIFHGYIDIQKFQKLIDSLVYNDSKVEFRIYRMKGILHIYGSNQLFVLQSVHDIFDIKPINITINSSEDSTEGYNKIILIGNNIPIQLIEENMIACCTKTLFS